uniref:Uncharacterized protein n=1 Tax=Anguilla anguilla TaxID=7936 RepID=A0A0E9RZG8_ANGAN
MRVDIQAVVADCCSPVPYCDWPGKFW